MTIEPLTILINTLKNKPKIYQTQNCYSSHKFYKIPINE